MTKFHRYPELPSRKCSRIRTAERNRFRIPGKTKMIRFLTLGGIIAAALVYLISVTSVSAQGFQITTLQKRIEEVQRDNEKMELRVAELQAGATIQEAANRLGLVETRDVTYVEADSAVAFGE
ncbi:MAG: hypothetical protein HYV34_04460 [Candidatus Kerfeldbacteria bacterium]|nr:hypothetical protein [Candidatus Kerfeldbacteria bacterium]